jgi:glycosyltransferase involved in cell wall biosynthesis
MTNYMSNTSSSNKSSTASKASVASIASAASNASKASSAFNSSPPVHKVLIITYYWPPSGGAGVQRWLKFSKYLPQYSWEPVILTVDPEYAAYPAIDDSLEKEIPEGLKIYRTKATDWYKLYGNDKTKVPSAGFAKNKDNTFRGKLSRFIRGNFFIPDPRRGWNRFAYRKACDLITDEGITNIISTSPPHSTQLIGLKLKKKFPGITWIADFRDPWTDIYYYKMFRQILPVRMLNKHYERKVIDSADLVISVGKSLSRLLKTKIRFPADKFKILTNGYDESDFSELVPGRKDKFFIITYVGTISDSYPVEGFLRIISDLKKINGRDILFRTVGQISEHQETLILKYLEEKNRLFIPYTDHSSSIRYMLESDILLLVIPDHPKNELIITGKLYEYIRSGNPVLCLGPSNGDAAEILNESGRGYTFGYYDIDRMSEFLRIIPESTGIKFMIEEWDRKRITEKLVNYLKT